MECGLCSIPPFVKIPVKDDDPCFHFYVNFVMNE